MPFPQRLPIVNGDDGQWGDIILQWLKKEHYDDGTDNAVNGGHKTVTIRAGTATAGTAPLKLTSGTLMSSPEAGAVEFLTDTLYFTITTGAVRKTIAAYDDSSGATGDIYYRSSAGAFTRLGIGSTGNVLKVASGLPSWGSVGTFTDTNFTLQDDGDTSKQLQFQLSGIGTGTTKTITVPDSNTTLPIASQIVTIAGPTAARTYTFPDAAATIARTDAANTFTGHQTVEGVTSTGATGTGKFVFDTSPTINTPTFTAWDGWISDTNTWTFGSSASYANTFTISSSTNYTTTFTKGTRIKLTNSTVKYFVVIASSFASNTTTVTINGGDNYTLANAAISATFYSYMANPQGYPTWFDWTPTLNGWGTNPTNTVYRFAIFGTSITVALRQLTNGVSNAAAHTITAPVTAATITNMAWTNPALAVDNGTTQIGDMRIASAGTSITLDGIAATTNNTTSGSSRMSSGELTYEF